MDPIETFRKARKLIEKGWCKDVYAVDSYNKPVAFNSEAACKWSLDGALLSVAGFMHIHQLEKMLTAANPDIQSCIIEWHDHKDRTVEDVFTAIDNVIDGGRHDKTHH